MKASEHLQWSEEDQEIEQEFAHVIQFVREQEADEKIPKLLDQKVKRFARGSVFDEIEQSWIFGSGARLTLAILVFFAIAMLWLH